MSPLLKLNKEMPADRYQCCIEQSQKIFRKERSFLKKNYSETGDKHAC